MADGRDYVGTAAAVTLDGRPATICGRNLDFGWVKSLDGKLQAEWAWETIARIVETKEGAFRL